MILKVGVSEGDLVGDSKAVIQRAVDVVAMNGGGTVEVGPGVFTFTGSLHMKSGVGLVGSGPDTVLRRSGGPVSPLVVDADGEQTKVTVADASGFREGMDITVAFDNGVLNDPQSTATVTYIHGNTLYLDRRLTASHDIERKGVVFNGFHVISFAGVSLASVERLTVDANGAGTPKISCWGPAGICLREASYCRIIDCVVKGAADGVLGMVSHDLTIEGCQADDNDYFGIHLGSGTAKSLVRKNTCARNGRDGFYLCWRVQESRYEYNEAYENGQDGISIGHKDTDNVFIGNTSRNNTRHGVYFRADKVLNTGNRNAFRENTVQDNGDCGVYIEAKTCDLVFERNTIGDTRPEGRRTQRIGICAAPGTASIRCLGNEFGPHTEAATQGDMEGAG